MVMVMVPVTVTVSVTGSATCICPFFFFRSSCSVRISCCSMCVSLAVVSAVSCCYPHRLVFVAVIGGSGVADVYICCWCPLGSLCVVGLCALESKGGAGVPSTGPLRSLTLIHPLRVRSLSGTLCHSVSVFVCVFLSQPTVRHCHCVCVILSFLLLVRRSAK